MVSFPEALRNEAARLTCRVLRDAPARSNLADRTVRSIPGGDFAADVADGAFDAAERSACSLEGDDPKPGDNLAGVPGPPGQCDGVKYNGNMIITKTNGTEQQSGMGINWGPIQGVTIRKDVDGRDRAYVICRGSGDTPIQPPGTLVERASSPQLDYESVRIAPDNFIRVDGLPDDCGEFDTRPRYNGPLTYNEGDTEITVDVEIILDESVNNGPSLTIPLIYVDPSLELRPELDLDLEPELNFSGKGSCELDIEIGGDNTTGEPDAPEDAGQPGDIVGAVVVSQKTTNLQTTTEVDSDPTLFLPRCSTLLFGLRVGANRAWSTPQDCSLLVQYLDVPGDIPAYTFKAIPALGFSCTVYPVRKAVPLDIEPEVG